MYNLNIGAWLSQNLVTSNGYLSKNGYAILQIFLFVIHIHDQGLASEKLHTFNKWDLFSCINRGWQGGYIYSANNVIGPRGGGGLSLCQVVCESVVAVGLGLHFLYSEGNEGN